MKVFIFLLVFSGLIVNAQVGGMNGYQFLKFPSNAASAGMSNTPIALTSATDPSYMWHNPALLNSTMKKTASVSFSPFVANISYTTASYAFEQPKIGGTTGIGLQYMYYGIAEGRDESGQKTNQTLSANDFAITAGHSRSSGNITVGVNVKLAGSQLVNYNSFAMLTDMGAVFKHPKKDFSVALLIKNLGFPIKSYGAPFTVSMPFDVQAGVAFKPSHMPFRFSFLAHHLHRFNIAYDDPNNITGYDINGNPIREGATFGDNLARHFSVGGEFLLSKGFQVRLGYDHMKRRELKNVNEGGLSGFSLGFLLKIKIIELSYAYGFYHASGGSNTFTLVVKPGDFFKKATVDAVPDQQPAKE